MTAAIANFVHAAVNLYRSIVNYGVLSAAADPFDPVINFGAAVVYKLA